MLISAGAALAGAVVLLVSTGLAVWNGSMTAEEAYAGGLAESLSQATERILVDTRDMLALFDRLPTARCAPEHLRAMQEAGASRPYIRAIGFWRANERQCGVGFVSTAGLKPAHADRIFDTGVIAWWPSPQTEVGGTQMFLMRFGDHDAAIDPRTLLDMGPIGNRHAVLWVDGLRTSAVPWDATLPAPASLPIGVSIDRVHRQVLSRYVRNAVLPIDVVAMEPLSAVLGRHVQTLAIGAGIGLLLIAGWLYLIVRFWRYELNMATELRKALAAGGIEVHYQPVIDMTSGFCVGAEALARWQLDSGESVSPAVFIPVAEQAGLVQDLTIAVLARALRDCRQLLLGHPGMSINLNLSAADLRDDRIGRELSEQLAAAQLPASAIKLEITERALVNTDTARMLIRDLRRRGHQIAIDDFGTGYSSLSYLQSFEIDILKIDKSFVDAIGTEAATSQVIVHVIQMAASLGLQTVAEGVETAQHVNWLIGHGVGLGQGFLFSRPLTAGAFYDFVHAHCQRAAA
jgi:c-di-GMP phosphodiesterase